MLKIRLESNDKKYQFDAALTDNCKHILEGHGNEAVKLGDGVLDMSSWSLKFRQKDGMSVEFHFRKNGRGENMLIPWVGIAFEEGREVTFGFTQSARVFDKEVTTVTHHTPERVSVKANNEINELKKNYGSTED